jgi:hypothetical protein
MGYLSSNNGPWNREKPDLPEDGKMLGSCWVFSTNRIAVILGNKVIIKVK